MSVARGRSTIVRKAYADTRPWLQTEAVRPKSVVREMVETQLPFATYVKPLRLERAEGVLLRYISQG